MTPVQLRQRHLIERKILQMNCSINGADLDSRTHPTRLAETTDWPGGPVMSVNSFIL